MTTRAFWLQSAERAGKTFCQVLLAELGTAQVGIVHMPWVAALSVAAGATALSLISSIASARVGDGSPSLVP